MSTYAQDPSRKARILSLAVAWCFAVISACVGLNALIKSNQDKDKLKKLAPPPTVVFINTSDIFHVGVSATVASLVLAIQISIYAVGSVFSPTRSFFARTLRLQAGLLLANCAWLFATMIPYMIFYLHRQAKVTAFIGTTQLPDAIIKGVEAQSGSTGVYKKISYLRLLAIFPWIALFFALVSIVVLLKAASARSTAPPSHPPSSPSTSMMKETASDNEKITV